MTAAAEEPVVKPSAFRSDWAERAVLGGLLRDSRALRALGIGGRDFFDQRHTAIWEAMDALQAEGRRPTFSLVVGRLERDGVLAAVGGAEYVAGLADGALTSELPVLETHAETVREHSLTRSLLLLGPQLAERMERGIVGTEAVEYAASQLRRLAEKGRSERPATLYDLAEDLREDLASEDADEEPPGFVPTGIADLDQRLGGYPLATVSVLAGKTSHGKSATLLQSAEAAAKAGIGVVWLATEDLSRNTGARALSHESGVPASSLRRGRAAVGEAGLTRLRALRPGEHLRRIHVVKANGLDARALVAQVRLLQASNEDIRLVVYDYLNRIPVPRGGDRFAMQVEAMNVFDDAAKDDGCAWVIGSQFRKTEADEPKLQDLRGASEVSDIAKFTIFVHRPRFGEGSDDNVIKVWTPKVSDDAHVEAYFDWDGPLMTVGQHALSEVELEHRGVR